MKKLKLALRVLIGSLPLGVALLYEPRVSHAEPSCLSDAGVSVESDSMEGVIEKLIATGKGLARAGASHAELRSFYECADQEIKGSAADLRRSELLLSAGKTLLQAGDLDAAGSYFSAVVALPPAFCGNVNVGPCLTAEARAGLSLIAFQQGDRDLAAAQLNKALEVDEERSASTPIDYRHHAVKLFSAVDDARATDFASRDFLLIDRFFQSFVQVMARSGRSADGPVLKLEATQWSIVNVGGAAFSRRLTDAAVAKQWLATVLRTRGALQDAAAGGWAARQEVYRPEDESAARAARVLRARARELSIQGGAADEIRRLNAEAEYLEHELTLSSVKVAAPAVDVQSIVDKVAATLAPNQVLVEIVSASQLSWVDASLRVTPGDARYYAFVLDHTGDTRVVDLGQVSKLDKLAADMIAAVGDPESDPLPPARALYQRLWTPLKLDPAAVKRVVVAADGPLQLVPFAALHSQQRYLGEELSISYVTTGRDRLRTYLFAPIDDAVIVAAPDYSAGEAAPAVAEPLFEMSGKFPALPGTLREAKSIGKIFDTKPVVGAAADERFLRELTAPGILHIATHGLFGTSSNGPASGRGLLRMKLSLPGVEPPAPDPDPSEVWGSAALVMAGVDQRSRSGDASSDGFFTAADFLTKDLSRTQLVTLSACETGVGQVRSGQGVFGFRRAIMAAGAQSLVTSLWHVDDEATTDMMVAFYNDLAEGASREVALQRAAGAARAKRSHPYFWAPFILLGRTDALDRAAGDTPVCKR